MSLLKRSTNGLRLVSAATFAMVKPRATREHLGEILDEILHCKLTIRCMETRALTKEEAEFLYREHAGKDFYEALIEYTLSGPVVLMCLTMPNGGTDVVGYWRLVMGNTDSSKAATATIRARFGNHAVLRENAVHGAATVEDAEAELRQFFPALADECIN